MTKQEPEFGLRAAPYRRMSFLSKKYVPQGLAVLPELSLLIAAYMEDGGSCLFHIDRDGRTSALSLMESELEPHLGHVGGLALGSSELWIASSGQLLRFSFETTSLPDTDTLIATHVLDLPHKASIATYFDGYVYVGEFAKTTDEPQPMLYKYSETELRSGVTEAVASYPLPIQAQGVAISATGIYVVSSFGPKQSKAYFAEDPGSLKHAEILGPMPAGAEGLTLLPGAASLMVVFESAALKYRDRWSENGATLTDWIWEYRPDKVFP